MEGWWTDLPLVDLSSFLDFALQRFAPNRSDVGWASKEDFDQHPKHACTDQNWAIRCSKRGTLLTPKEPRGTRRKYIFNISLLAPTSGIQFGKTQPLNLGPQLFAAPFSSPQFSSFFGGE